MWLFLTSFSALEECLLTMPFTQVTQLLQLLDLWLQHGWEVELCCRCLFFLLRIHHHQLVTNSTLLSTVDSLRQHTSQCVSSIKVPSLLMYCQIPCDLFSPSPEHVWLQSGRSPVPAAGIRQERHSCVWGCP